ncbi:WD repeat-containing protein 74 [Phytophthora pseudosyringae]|uniref:WD repeat-containing protein 74 n=1 Tax=Phytophthora pseudosyringae TaxID=221518 RepID=A0A8T1W283_9STRA|nr:WD repeat-containing protein 74 [Phytophthora pseudosyringae]
MRVLVGDETGLLKSIELEKNEQRILSSREQPQARARGIQRLCWYADEREAADFQRNAVLARADGVVESYEASHGKSLSASRDADWSWAAPGKAEGRARCVGLDVVHQFGSVVQCSDAGDVLVRSTLEDAGKPAAFNVGGDLSVMRLGAAAQSVVAVGGKEHDLNLWSLETQQVLFKAKNVTHDKLDMRVPVWVKDLRFLSSPGSSNGHRVIVGSGHRHVRIYDSNTKRRPVQQLDNFGENPIQSLCVSPDETRLYVGDTAGNLDILDLRTLKHMGRCTGPVGSIRDIACHPTLPYIAAVGLDRMVHVFDVNTRKYRHTIYAKQRLSSVLFCADGLKDIPVVDDEPSRKKHKSADDEVTFDDDDDDMEEEAYEGLEISEDEDEDPEDDDSE